MAQGTMRRGALDAFVAKAFTPAAAAGGPAPPRPDSLLSKLHAKQTATARELAVRRCCGACSSQRRDWIWHTQQ